jgi:ribosomal protein S17E
LCREQDLDPVIAIEALDVLDPKLDYWENKQRYAEELRSRGVQVEEQEVKGKLWEEMVAEREAEEKERLREEILEEMGMTYEEAWEYFKLVAGEELASKYKGKFTEWWEGGLRLVSRDAQKQLINRLADMVSTVERRVRFERVLPETVEEAIIRPYEPPQEYRGYYLEWMRRFKGEKP